ncbi:MAG TPA: hypothetical protein VFA94_04120, partial [Acidimicrobiales bacterium]|nr:hypothetical protein [Acidimicrobiales bacterium]
GHGGGQGGGDGHGGDGGKGGHGDDGHHRPPQYPPGKCEMRTSESQVEHGKSFTAAGDGFAPGSAVDLTLNGQKITTVHADDTGAFVTNVAVPKSQAAGAYQLIATGDDGAGGTQVLSAAMTVASAMGARGSNVATTPLQSAVATAPAGHSSSSSTAPMEALAAGLVVLGLGAGVAARRRVHGTQSGTN